MAINADSAMKSMKITEKIQSYEQKLKQKLSKTTVTFLRTEEETNRKIKWSLYPKISCRKCICGWKNLWIQLLRELVFNEPKNKKSENKRQSSKKKQQMDNNIDVYYNNINGLLSKQDSLVRILQMKQPDVVTLCETKLHKNSQYDIDGYEVLKSSLKAGKEGIIVTVKEGTFENAEIIFESDRKHCYCGNHIP